MINYSIIQGAYIAVLVVLLLAFLSIKRKTPRWIIVLAFMFAAFHFVSTMVGHESEMRSMRISLAGTYRVMSFDSLHIENDSILASTYLLLHKDGNFSIRSSSATLSNFKGRWWIESDGDVSFYTFNINGKPTQRNSYLYLELEYKGIKDRMYFTKDDQL